MAKVQGGFDTSISEGNIPGVGRAGTSGGSRGSSVAGAIAGAASGVISAALRAGKDRRIGGKAASINEELERMRGSGVNRAQRDVWLRGKYNEYGKSRGASELGALKTLVETVDTKQVYNADRQSFQIIGPQGAILGERPQEDFQTLPETISSDVAMRSGVIEGEMPEVSNTLGATANANTAAGKQFAGQADLYRQVSSLSDLPDMMANGARRLQSLVVDPSISGEARTQFQAVEYGKVMNQVDEAMEFYVNGQRELLLKDPGAPYNLTSVQANLTAMRRDFIDQATSSGFASAAGVSPAQLKDDINKRVDLFGGMAEMALKIDNFSLVNAMQMEEMSNLNKIFKQQGDPRALLKAMASYTELDALYGITPKNGRISGIASTLQSIGFNQPTLLSLQTLLNQNKAAVQDVSTLPKLKQLYQNQSAAVAGLPTNVRSMYASTIAGQVLTNWEKMKSVLIREHGKDSATAIDKYEAQFKQLWKMGNDADPDKVLGLLNSISNMVSPKAPNPSTDTLGALF